MKMLGLIGVPVRPSPESCSTRNPSLPPWAEGHRKAGNLVRMSGKFSGAQHGKSSWNLLYKLPCSRYGRMSVPQAQPGKALQVASGYGSPDAAPDFIPEVFMKAGGKRRLAPS